MCKLRKELNRVSYEVMDDIQNIINNPAIKAEKRAKDLIIDTWHYDLKRAMDNLENDYDKSVMYGFNNFFTHNHAKKLSMDDLIAMMSAVISIMNSVRDGDFNENR